MSTTQMNHYVKYNINVFRFLYVVLLDESLGAKDATVGFWFQVTASEEVFRSFCKEGD